MGWRAVLFGQLSHAIVRIVREHLSKLRPGVFAFERSSHFAAYGDFARAAPHWRSPKFQVFRSGVPTARWRVA